MTTAARGFPAFPPRPGRRGRSWWAREFVAAMEDTALDLTMTRRGRRFAGSGRVGPLTVSPGRIAAVVDDPDGSFDVVVRLETLGDAEWDRFLRQVETEAGHLAALLDGDVPRSLVQSADAANVPLLPTIGDLESECDCPDIGDPCQHAAALCYQTAWLLDDDPFVLLLLRGRGRDQLLDAVTGSARGPGADEPVPATVAYAAAALPLPGPGWGTLRFRPPVLPPAPGVEEVAQLVVDAAARARSLLRGPPDDPP